MVVLSVVVVCLCIAVGVLASSLITLQHKVEVMRISAGKELSELWDHIDKNLKK